MKISSTLIFYSKNAKANAVRCTGKSENQKPNCDVRRKKSE